ncbi:serine/threonine protein kinase [Galdieria sulphuraria]|uniref:Serine/threonine protein kinase n=1 Tax=Galdieria sulphuraria TaxID=130081 RepID=M2X6R3_GALSU|nr:serine/threonine protein kinase [Galdieria sulphuraria]EME32205.1 serine/threonine protein kinase [Galdieria sulphuraria]|eukprot:XP_005708725.1 serine/threonine protein kinase [Galdieria sulphuraria]
MNNNQVPSKTFKRNEIISAIDGAGCFGEGDESSFEHTPPLTVAESSSSNLSSDHIDVEWGMDGEPWMDAGEDDSLVAHQFVFRKLLERRLWHRKQGNKSRKRDELLAVEHPSVTEGEIPSSVELFREKVKEKVDSPYIYYFDAALIGFNLLVFLVKYITMYKLAWSHSFTSRLVYFIETWIQLGLNVAMWFFFLVETAVRMWAWGFFSYFEDKFNVADFITVVLLTVPTFVELGLYSVDSLYTLKIEHQWKVQLAQVFTVVMATLRLATMIRIATVKDIRRQAHRSALELKEQMEARGMEENWKISEHEVEFGNQIGAGSFGVVQLALWHGTLVAVKTLDRVQMDEDSLSIFEKEVKISLMLRHPNIVLFMGVVYRQDGALSLVTEYCDKGDLRRVIHNNRIRISTGLRMKFAIGAAHGLAYLHSRVPPIVHRDLKSGNLLVDSGWNVKISDFGLSILMGAMRIDTNVVGTLQYTAPEVLRNEKSTPASDIYSLGVIFWELGTREVPFKGKNRYELFIGVAESGLKPDFELLTLRAGKEYTAVVAQCLAFHAEERPDIEQIIDLLDVLVEEDKEIASNLAKKRSQSHKRKSNSHEHFWRHSSSPPRKSDSYSEDMENGFINGSHMEGVS